MKRLGQLVFLVGFGFCDASSFAAAPAAEHRPTILTDQDVVAVQTGVRDSLKDPASALFRRAFGASRNKDGVVTVCGYVNAKNSYGGYTGDELFLGVLVSNGRFVPIDIAGTDDDTLILRQMCLEAGIAP